METKRIEWIDIAKGITILLVIFGHGIDEPLRGIIYSFHMPLFFILSCITFRFSENREEFIAKTRKAFKYLFLTALYIVILTRVIYVAEKFTNWQNNPLPYLKQAFKNFVISFFMGSGVDVHIGKKTITKIGIPWFLLVLFFGRTLFDYLQLKLKSKTWLFYIAIALCSISGVIAGQLIWLPFSFDIALAIQPLFLCGYYLKKVDLSKGTVKNLFLTFLVWIVLYGITIYWKKTYMELAFRRYTLFPFSYVCAIAGTMFTGYLCQLISKLKFITKPLMYLGKHTIVIVWIHSADTLFDFLWELTSNDNINLLIRVSENLLVFTIVMLIITLIQKCKNK